MIIIQLDSEQLSNLIQSSVRKVLKDTSTSPATQAVDQQGQSIVQAILRSVIIA